MWPAGAPNGVFWGRRQALPIFWAWCPMLAVLAAQLGTPRGRYDEHSGKFPSIVKPRFIRPVGERNQRKGLC
jgi:hypothetical protein